MSARTEELKQAYADIHAQLKKVCVEAKRKPDELRLVAVSKTYPVEDIKAVYDLGQKIFAENRVQDLLKKIEEFKTRYPELTPEWHLIGTLQRNKVRKIVGEVSLIHSVHSLSLLKEIEKRAKQKGIVQNILLQVDIAKEESKHGLTEEELAKALDYLAQHAKAVRLKGLMTMAPLTSDPKIPQAVFHRLHTMSKELQVRFPEATELSMGMSSDYEAAILEGSTLVRIGTAIFGQRSYL